MALGALLKCGQSFPLRSKICSPCRLTICSTPTSKRFLRRWCGHGCIPVRGRITQFPFWRDVAIWGAPAPHIVSPLNLQQRMQTSTLGPKCSCAAHWPLLCIKMGGDHTSDVGLIGALPHAAKREDPNKKAICEATRTQRSKYILQLGANFSVVGPLIVLKSLRLRNIYFPEHRGQCVTPSKGVMQLYILYSP